jgi:hypothetical protein
VVLVGIVDHDLTLSQSDAINSDRDVSPVRVVELLAGIEDGRGLDRSVNGELGLEVGGAHVEVELGGETLSRHQIASSESFDFPALKGAVLVVETFSTGAGSGGQVLVGLELPVSPSDNRLIGDIGNLADLLSAGSLGNASTKFGNHQWDLKSFGVFGTLTNSLLVEGETSVSQIG